MTQISRRTILKGSAAVAAASIIPWTAKSYGAIVGANEDIRVATIGLNGRGMSHTDAYRKMKGTRLVALCDADEAVLKKEQARLMKASPSKNSPTTKPTTKPSELSTAAPKKAGKKEKGNKGPDGDAGDRGEKHEEAVEKPLKLELYTDLRKLLDSKDVDAITIATPNHWHSLAAIWAIQAGKDVYCEKPVSHNVWEGRMLVNAWQRSKQIVAAGTQSRSRTALRDAFKWMHEGNLGKIQVARGLCYKRRGTIGQVEGEGKVPTTVDYDLWLGPAPKEAPHRTKFHYEWHWFWAYGNGDLGNQGIHQMDVARWALGKDHISPKVMSVGGRFGYKDDGETPNTQFVVHDYGDCMLIFEVRGLPDRPGSPRMDKYKNQSVGNVIECEGGYISTDAGGGAVACDWEDKEIKSFKGGEDHFANFIKAVRSRKQSDLNAPILDGHLSSAMCHTGNISYRLGKQQSADEIKEELKANKAAMATFEHMVDHLAINEVDVKMEKATFGPMLTMDPKTERFIGNDKANALLTREYRKPFAVPEISA